MDQYSLLLLAAALTSVCIPAMGQGTRADYERANTLAQRTAGNVFGASVKPEWIGETGRFWYRNDLPDGRREFLLVDPAIPAKNPAFDYARLAAALSKMDPALAPVDPERLPIDRIAFDPDPNRLLVQAGAKTYALDLRAYTLSLAKEELGRAQSFPPDSGPRASRTGGEATVLTFQNHTGQEISLTWLDTDGQRHDYGTVSAGAEREMHTYAGHLWLVAAKDGRPLGRFVAADVPTLAVIDGPVVSTVAPRRRRQAPSPDGVLSPDGKWRIQIRDHNAFLVRINAAARTGVPEEIPLTHDGTAEDSYEDSYEDRVEWSPDSKKVVIFKTIPAQEHKVFYVESSPPDQVQPELRSYDYLKPGDRIAHPRPHLFDIATRQDIPIPASLFPNPWSISDLQWDPDSRQFTFLYNQRGHQVLRLIAVDAAAGTPRTVIDEESRTFIDYSGKLFLHRLDATHEAIWMSERDGWNHLYLYDTAASRVKNQITKGEWVVRGVDRVDDEKRQIWFRAGGIVPGQDPYYIQYCRVNFDGSGLTLLTEGDGDHTVVYSPDGKYLVDTYSRVDLPPVTTLRPSEDGKKLLDLEQGDASQLLATGWKFPERFVAKGRDGKTDIYGVLFRPSNFDPARKYPVVENIYAGPQDSFAPKRFAAVSGSQEVAELGFIVVQIDGMGTNNRSRAFHDVCWKNLSDAGLPDRILWIKAAAAKYPYMDLARVGIYGTSAGGQSALAALLLHGDFYKVAVADSGCHDNRMDKIWWNEQWMGWPVGPEYAANSNVTLAPRLEGKLLLMVGEADHNVDPASTMQVVNALIKAGKDFDLLDMPGAGHGVAGTPYGRRRLRDFLVRNLLHVEPRAE